MKKLAIFIAALFLFSAATLAEELPYIAIYVTGDVPDGEKKALGKFILTQLVESGRYRAVEQPGAFFNEVAALDKSRDGAIDYEQA